MRNKVKKEIDPGLDAASPKRQSERLLGFTSSDFLPFPLQALS